MLLMFGQMLSVDFENSGSCGKRGITRGALEKKRVQSE